MNELIKINYETERPTVLGRDLHEFLGITERYSSWFDRMLNYGFEVDVDFTGVKSFTVVNNGAERELQDHQLTIEMAKEISMIQRNDKGKQARLYFIECERKLTTQIYSYMIDDPIERAKQWIVEQEHHKAMLEAETEKRIQVEKEKAILLHTNKVYSTTEIAKELNLKSAIQLNKLLCENKIQFKQNDTYVLYSKYANKGYTEIKQTVLDSGKIVYDRKWTDIGRDFLLKKFA